MPPETCIIRVTRFGNLIGCIRFDERDCGFLAEASIPRVVLSDIRVTFYRERVIFGYSGDGYVWEEVTEIDEPSHLHFDRRGRAIWR